METQIATQTVANNSGRSRLTACGAISHESTDVIWFKTFTRNRPPAKLGKQEIADVAQAVETRCRRQPAYILEILVKALKLFTDNLRNRRRFRRNDSLRAQHAKQMTERAAKVCGGARACRNFPSRSVPTIGATTHGHRHAEVSLGRRYFDNQ
jgi:hypothetical protein